jgi:hypothetical protein
MHTYNRVYIRHGSTAANHMSQNWKWAATTPSTRIYIPGAQDLNFVRNLGPLFLSRHLSNNKLMLA